MSEARIGHAIEQQPEDLNDNEKSSSVKPSSIDTIIGPDGEPIMRVTTFIVGNENVRKGSKRQYIKAYLKRPMQEENRQLGKTYGDGQRGYTEACHKLADSLGGEATEENLYMGRASVNHGPYSRLEIQDRKFLMKKMKKEENKRTVLLQVIERFGNKRNPQRPTYVQRVAFHITEYNDGRETTMTRSKLPNKAADNEPSNDTNHL